MLYNYIKVAFRNLMRNSAYSFINIVGLSVGLASSILIALWVIDEVSYDKFHSNADDLHQLWINATFDGKVNTWNSVPYPAYQDVKGEDSRIKNTAVSDWGGSHLLTAGEIRSNKRGYHVSEEFLEMFKFPLVKGQANTVLDGPNSIVLTESAAKVLFGDKDPINQLVRMNNNDDLKVTGVLKDIPKNSSFLFDFLVPHKLIEQQAWFKDEGGSWDNNSYQVYVELQPGVAKAEVDGTIKGLLVKRGIVDVPREFFLHPLKQWHLYSNFENGKMAGGMVDYVKGFSFLAIFILAIACINFMNLATARSERRAREVGVRKSVGSGRKELVFQFLGESIFITFIAFLFAVVLVELAFPFYNSLTNKTLFLDFSSPQFWFMAVGIILLTGMVSGSYPALYLSSFNVVRVLKGKIEVGRNGTTPRKVLVVLQFFFSTFLIISTIVISQQIQHTKKRNLGYNQENLITIPYTNEIEKNFKVIRNELAATGVVSSMTKSNSPVTDIYSNNFVDWDTKPKNEKVIFITIATELDYTKTMGIKLLQGRDFTNEADSSSILINKAALETMGMEEPIGAQVTVFGDRRVTIVGVIDNVVMGTPFRKPSPLFITYQPFWASAVTVRLEKTSDLQRALKKVEAVFTKFNPAYPFEYTFVDEEFKKKYTTINMTSNLANIFAVLAILITGLGLFGLAAFTAEQRTKEIGIRKVMGASVPGLVALIAKEFSWLVIIALVISAPVSWWFMNNFLDRYAYRIDFPWWALALAGFISLAFAMIIVSAQALKAATMNPSKSLRSE
jgi:ABC-type antimicrobial peptide transport system permease subunit